MQCQRNKTKLAIRGTVHTLHVQKIKVQCTPKTFEAPPMATARYFRHVRTFSINTN